MLTSTLAVLLAAPALALTGAAATVRPLAPARAAVAQMAAAPVVDFAGAAQGEEDVSLKVAKAGAYVVHRKVVAEQANMR